MCGGAFCRAAAGNHVSQDVWGEGVVGVHESSWMGFCHDGGECWCPSLDNCMSMLVWTRNAFAQDRYYWPRVVLGSTSKWCYTDVQVCALRCLSGSQWRCKCAMQGMLKATGQPCTRGINVAGQSLAKAQLVCDAQGCTKCFACWHVWCCSCLPSGKHASHCLYAGKGGGYVAANST
jgi:hypothetical protein